MMRMTLGLAVAGILAGEARNAIIAQRAQTNPPTILAASRAFRLRRRQRFAAADADWHEHVVLEIGPHPELSETQQKVIALDYGIDDTTSMLFRMK